MNVYSSLLDAAVVETLKNGGVAVIPTDTLYGICGRADMPDTVERIYELRNRDRDKRMIVLIADVVEGMPSAVRNYWPGKVSIVIGETAYRLPDYHELRELLRQAGPLVAPSANFQGQEPAHTIAEAQAYFGDAVDCYVDVGRLDGAPSRIIKIEEGGETTVLRA